MRPTPLEIIKNMRDKNFREEIILEEVEKELKRLDESPIAGGELDWKQEYNAAVNEIGQLQDQLKEAEAEIRYLQNELRNNG